MLNNNLKNALLSTDQRTITLPLPEFIDILLNSKKDFPLDSIARLKQDYVETYRDLGEWIGQHDPEEGICHIEYSDEWNKLGVDKCRVWDSCSWRISNERRVKQRAASEEYRQKALLRDEKELELARAIELNAGLDYDSARMLARCYIVQNHVALAREGFGVDISGVVNSVVVNNVVIL